MPKNPLPTPPSGGQDIIIPRDIPTGTELSLLDEFSTAYECGDIGRAARCTLKVLELGLDPELQTSMVSSVSYMAFVAEFRHPAISEMLCKAVDLGITEHAYNAANYLMDLAQTPADFKEAEKYYLVAMSYSKNPALQAAAHVNYCPIIRDGLISGTPDWPKSIEIYEVAAHMGLVKAMFNAGNMSSCLANQGLREYGARAARWFTHALDVRDKRTPTLDMESYEELAEVFEQCEVGLSDLHVHDFFDGADQAEGIRLARLLSARGNPRGAYNLGAAYTRRLKHLASPPRPTPGENWMMVLASLDWRFEGVPRKEKVILSTTTGTISELDIDRLTVSCADGRRIPLYVAHSACLPVNGGQRLLQVLANALREGISEDFFLLPRKARFQFNEGSSHTPIYVRQGHMLSQQSLWMGCTPEAVLQNAADNVAFLDPRFGVENSWIPIALNALDEGLVVAGNAVVTQSYIDVGEDWCMPFFNEEALALEFGMILKR